MHVGHVCGDPIAPVPWHVSHVSIRVICNLLYCAAHCVPEIDLDLIFQVSARLVLHFHFRAAAPAKELAEQIAETRSPARAARCTRCALAAPEIKSAKIKIDVRAAVIAARRWTTRAWLEIVAVESVLVIHLSLLRVRQHVVRFLQLLEFLFRAFVPRIKVRMILPRQLTKRRTNILRARLSRNSQQFVKILFCRSSHDFRAANGADLFLENFTVALQWHSHFWLCVPPKSPQLPTTKKGAPLHRRLSTRDLRPASRRPLCVLPF